MPLLNQSQGFQSFKFSKELPTQNMKCGEVLSPTVEHFIIVDFKKV
jgi:hypothetical protein